MARATTPVMIDGIAFDALIESTEIHESEVPTYPTEAGFEVGDSIILKAKQLNMKLFLTNTPVTWRHRNGTSLSRVNDVLRRLRELYHKKQPVTVITTDSTYSNMAIMMWEDPKNVEYGSSREIAISFKELRVTERETVGIPASYGRGGETGAPAGTANTASRNTTGNRNDGNRGSILHGLASGAGLLGR